MQGIQSLFPIATLLVGIVFSANVLNIKSEFELTFITADQKLKMYYFNLLTLSGIVSFLGAILYIVIEVYILQGRTIIETKDLNTTLALALVIFLCCLLMLGPVLKIIRNFFIKEEYKVKTILPGIGEVYLLRMMDKDLCICSKEPSSDLVLSHEEYYLVKLETFLQQPLTRVNIPKPERTFFQKLLN